MNSSIRALLAVVSAASVALATVSVAVDASTACTGQTNKFAGTDPRGPNNFGASAYIGKRVPALCGATYSVSAIWAMSAAYSNGGYAQAGYVRFQGQSTVYPFGEARQDYGHNYQRRTLIVTIPAGTTKYWESYNVQAHKTTAYWNDGSTTWNLLISSRYVRDTGPGCAVRRSGA